MKKKTINKKKISKECYDLDASFLDWLRVRLPVYLREAGKIVDLDWRRFVYKGEELTQRQLIERMIYLLKLIEGKDFWDSKEEYIEPCEDILWYTNGDKYTFNKVPSKIEKKTGGLGQKNGCKFRALSNVWTDISPIVPWSKERVAHPTQKPVELMERLVTVFTNKDDTVLDFTMGSGTTGVACLNLSRNFIGIEIDENYFNIAKERIEMKE